MAWVWPAFVGRAKSVTRRQWTDDYARRFHQGDVCLVYDRSPRVHGSPIGRLRLTADPSREHISTMPDEDYAREGFAFMEAHRHLIPKSSPLRERPSWSLKDYFDWWRQQDACYYVVRFAIVDVDAAAST